MEAKVPVAEYVCVCGWVAIDVSANLSIRRDDRSTHGRTHMSGMGAHFVSLCLCMGYLRISAGCRVLQHVCL